MSIRRIWDAYDRQAQAEGTAIKVSRTYRITRQGKRNRRYIPKDRAYQYFGSDVKVL